MKRFPDYDYYGRLFQDQLTDPIFVRSVAEWYDSEMMHTNESHPGYILKSLLLSYASLLERTENVVENHSED